MTICCRNLSSLVSRVWILPSCQLHLCIYHVILIHIIIFRSVIETRALKFRSTKLQNTFAFVQTPEHTLEMQLNSAQFTLFQDWGHVLIGLQAAW